MLRPELEAQRVLREARAELESLGEPWDAYTVDVEFVATLLFGLGVQHVPDLRVGSREYAAFLDGDAKLIAVEGRHHEHRQRFSVAHEVGHYVLHFQPQPRAGSRFICSQADMEVAAETGPDLDRGLHLRREWEANLFAGELLMPAQPVLAMFRVVGGRTAQLARHFKVSPQAMEIRLRRLPLPFKPR